MQDILPHGAFRGCESRGLGELDKFKLCTDHTKTRLGNASHPDRSSPVKVFLAPNFSSCFATTSLYALSSNCCLWRSFASLASRSRGSIVSAASCGLWLLGCWCWLLGGWGVVVGRLCFIECSFIIFHFENNRVGVPSWPRIKDSRGTKRSSCSRDNPYFMVELENLSSHESPTGRFLNEDLYVNAAAVKSLQKQ